MSSDREERVEVHRVGPNEYRVEVRGSRNVSAHRVTVPSGLLTALGAGEHELQLVVTRSFAFLLAREPADAILATFSLAVISQYFPEYISTLRAQFGGRPPSTDDGSGSSSNHVHS